MPFLNISIHKYNQDRKSVRHLKNIARHNIRAYKARNVYIEASKNNEHEGAYDVNAEKEHRLKMYQNQVRDTGKRVRKNKVRKNAVTCVTAVMQVGASHFRKAKNKEEYLELDKGWVAHCKEKLYDEFGKENVISIDIHRDETRQITLEDGFTFFPTHVHASIFPLDPSGKLNASYYLDGKDKLRNIHTRFAQGEYVEKHGLQRGLDRRITGKVSRDVNNFYNLLEANDITPETALAAAIYTKAFVKDHQEMLSNLEGVSNYNRLLEDVQDKEDMLINIFREHNQCTFEEASKMLNDRVAELRETKEKDRKKAYRELYKETSSRHSKEELFKQQQSAVAIMEDNYEYNNPVKNILDKGRAFGSHKDKKEIENDIEKDDYFDLEL